MEYRREIDGLRAIAVIPVILFHAGLSQFSGGFVGVDVFFVISGYLITSILISDIERGSFSIVKFYERRARRILPALIFVLVAVSPFAILILPPEQLQLFWKGIISSLLFFSNILFWRETGYFSNDAELNPLLHTWSLSVEEQFYLVFPIALFLIWKGGKAKAAGILFAAALASFALSEWGWRNYPTANFYLIPTRAWELLTGSLCAFALHNRKPLESNLLSGLGLFLIFGSVLFLRDVPFPSYFALPPVLGTALIILFGGSQTMTARILSLRPLVFIGLISYSAYLWHQPLFALARNAALTHPSAVAMGALTLLSFVLAYFTWRYVEAPFRGNSSRIFPRRRQVFQASGLASGALAFSAGIALLGNGFPQRSVNSEQIERLTSKLAINPGLREKCDGGFTLRTECATASKPSLVLWGDSYAMHLVDGLVADDHTVAMRQFTMSSCSPLRNVAYFDENRLTSIYALNCIEFNKRVFDWVSEKHSVKTVVLSSPFRGVLNDHIYPSVPDRDRFETVRRALLSTVTDLRNAGKRVVVISPTPRANYDIGQCLSRALYQDRPDSLCDFHIGEPSKATRLLKSIEDQVPIIWLHDQICPARVCNVQRGKIFLYRDTGHLSREGSALLGVQGRWVEKINRIAR